MPGAGTYMTRASSGAPRCRGTAVARRSKASRPQWPSPRTRPARSAPRREPPSPASARAARAPSTNTYATHKYLSCAFVNSESVPEPTLNLPAELTQSLFDDRPAHTLECCVTACNIHAQHKYTGGPTTNART
eukprot:9154014-Pyramimonas_sp.AAC.1